MQQIASGLYMHRGKYISQQDKIQIAAFDLDWTLIRTIHGRFPKNANDWVFLPHRILVLQEYIDAGYTIVIFTNQGYTGAKQKTAIERINNVVQALNENNIYPWVFAATNKEKYGKPDPIMWQTLEQYFTRDGYNINKLRSFYVGDAAGRETDFSADDIQFAHNVGIIFYPTDEFFPHMEIPIPQTQTMLILMGMPGSGKSTYYHEKLKPHGFVHINQDILKSKAKVIKTLETALREGKSVAVDATNPTKEKREEYLRLAYKYQVPTLILYFVSNGYERNKLRTSDKVPDIAYNMYFSKLVEPSFEIDKVPVVEME